MTPKAQATEFGHHQNLNTFVLSGHHQESKRKKKNNLKATYRIRENICKPYTGGILIKNILIYSIFESWITCYNLFITPESIFRAFSGHSQT